MKCKFMILGVWLTLASSMAMAGSTVCSSEDLYYSHDIYDSGIAPQPGTVIGKSVIVYRGETLLNFEMVSGLGQHAILPYRVDLVGEEQILEELGGDVSGSKVFKQSAALSQVDSLTGLVVAELVKSEVVCRTKWAMVP